MKAVYIIESNKMIFRNKINQKVEITNTGEIKHHRLINGKQNIQTNIKMKGKMTG
jgi:hypothetical protein